MQLNSLIIRILDSLRAIEKVSERSLVGQYSAQHSEDIECRSSKLAVVLDNGHEEYVMPATYICILTAFSLVPRKESTRRCCFIHLKTALPAISACRASQCP